MSKEDYERGRAIEKKFRKYMPVYYKTFYKGSRYVEDRMYYDADIDLGVRDDTGNITSIEEKFANDVLGDYTAILVEHIQNSKEKSPGWIETCKAKEMVYCWCCSMKEQVRVIHLDFVAFKKWYLQKYKNTSLQMFYTSDTRPIGRLVEYEDIPKDMVIRTLTIKRKKS